MANKPPAQAHGHINVPNELGRTDHSVFFGSGSYEANQIGYVTHYHDGPHGPILILHDRGMKLPLRWVSAKVGAELHRSTKNPHLLVFERTVRAGVEHLAALPYAEDEWGDRRCLRVTEGAAQLLCDALGGVAPAEVTRRAMAGTSRDLTALA